jgi:hypothetical protein
MDNCTHVCMPTDTQFIPSPYGNMRFYIDRVTTVDSNLSPFITIISISYPGSWFQENTLNHFKVTTDYSS